MHSAEYLGRKVTIIDYPKYFSRRNKMNITDVKIRKTFDDGPMKAIASVTLDEQLAVHDIKVIYARDKYFIVMPSRKNPDDTYRDIVHPINASFRGDLEEAVLREYDAELVRMAEDCSYRDIVGADME